MLETLTFPGSCAQKTLASAMVKWEMATDKDEALWKIIAEPGVDFAKISNSVIAGLNSCANQLGIDANTLIMEKDLTPLVNLSSTQVITALDAIHKQWVNDNLTASKWISKFFNNKLSQYRGISHLPFEEAMVNYLFIEEYLKAGNCMFSIEELQRAFDAFRYSNDIEGNDLSSITEIAYGFHFTIVYEINDFRLKSIMENQPQLTEKIDKFLSSHEDTISMMGEMFSTL